MRDLRYVDEKERYQRKKRELRLLVFLQFGLLRCNMWIDVVARAQCSTGGLTKRENASAKVGS